MDNDQPENLTDFYTQATVQVHDEPCWLHSLEIVGTGADANTIVLYDGFSTADPIKLYITVAQNVTLPLTWPKPKRFSKALYLVAAAGTPYASGQYQADKKRS